MKLKFLPLFEKIDLETLLKDAAFKFSKRRSSRFEETNENNRAMQEFPVQNISHLRRAPVNNYEAKLLKNKSESSLDGILSLFFFPV